MNQFVRIAVFATTLSVMSLSACRMIPVAATTSTANTEQMLQHQKALHEIDAFILKGRFTVQNGQKGSSGGMKWWHQKGNDYLVFLNPFGGTVAQIELTDHEAQLTKGNGEKITTSSFEELSKKAIGWSFPIAPLSQWVLGKPLDSSLLTLTWNEKGEIATLHELDWTVEYLNYTNISKLTLPHQIHLQHADLKIKIVIEDWQINPVNMNHDH